MTVETPLKQDVETARMPRWVIVVAAIAILFGSATLKEGGTMLFLGGKEHAGPIVPFVLWFNFCAGFAYIACGVGIALGRRWAAHLAMVIAASTLLVFAAFGLHVLLGGAYAQRTMGAMTLRAGTWLVIAFIARSVLPRPERR